MNLDIEIPQREINKLTRSFRVKLVPRVNKRVTDLIEETTDLIYEDMRANVPVRSGDVKKSIRKSLKKGLNPQGVVEVRSFVGWFLETGTVNMSARPFAMPAYQKHIPTFIARLKLILS